MNKSLLVDTNILVYAIDADSKFHKRAVSLLSEPGNDLFTTSKNISEFMVVLTRSYDSDLSTIQCYELLMNLVAGMTILYPNSLSTSIFQELISKYKPRGLWIHDVEIASIGLAFGVTEIATHNVSDFERLSEVMVREI